MTSLYFMRECVFEENHHNWRMGSRFVIIDLITFQKDIIIIIIICACMYLRYPRMPEEGVRWPGWRHRRLWTTQHGRWELNSGPPEEQYMLSIAQRCLQHQFSTFIYIIQFRI